MEKFVKTTPSAGELLDMILEARADLEGLLELVPDEQRASARVQAGWTIRDILGHIAAWERLTLVRLEAVLSGSQPDIPPLGTVEEIDAQNARIEAQNAARPFDEVRAEFESAHTALMHRVASLDTGTVARRIEAPWGRGRPVWKLIGSNTCWHYPEHADAIRDWLIAAVRVRPEAPDDREAVHRVNAQAARPQEARLVARLRERREVLVSLVAETHGAVVGHALFTPVELRSEGGDVLAGAALGPVAVLPLLQRRGIGSQLIRAGLNALQAPFCAVLGHETYYPRFGFQPAAGFGIRCTWDVPDPIFMVQELKPGALEGRSGTIVYAPPFYEA